MANPCQLLAAFVMRRRINGSTAKCLPLPRSAEGAFFTLPDTFADFRETYSSGAADRRSAGIPRKEACI